MAFIMGNQKVGEAKAYNTTTEYEQEKEIKKLKSTISALIDMVVLDFADEEDINFIDSCKKLIK